MSTEGTSIEWKTIRIPAISYYKLAELSGILTALMGTKIPMSTIALWAISDYHDNYYRKMKEMLMNPDIIEEFRKEVGGELQRFVKVMMSPKYDEPKV